MGTAIKQNVDRLLERRGWTRYRLSKESGVAMSVIYSLGEKESGPTADKLLKIANALGCTVDELVR
ncbi:helix-turn-helix transcriptional regulator [Paenibacillus sp. FSL R10-2782]|uniref:helix-turn-helix transcriptional regulator n=1 Tax=Paenibacillus sp. FSL R10-2782 TaxID=2954661 RepID=UPI003158C84E